MWAVLADFPNIAAWNEAVTKSYAIGEAVEGVGAQRICELGDNGPRLRETVTEWTEHARMVIDIDEIQRMPINQARMTFDLADRGDQTQLTMNYEYAPKGGPLAPVVALMLKPAMRKGFNGFVDQLEVAAKI